MPSVKEAAKIAVIAIIALAVAKRVPMISKFL